MRPNIFVVSLIRLALVLVFLLGIFICCWLHPFISYLSSGLPFVFQNVEVTPEMTVQYYTKIIFHWICSLPCFIIVIMGFFDTFFTRKLGIFNSRSAKILRIMSWMLFISSIIFIFGNIIFMTFGWNLSPLYFNEKPGIFLGNFYCIIGVIGLIISFAIYKFYKYTACKITENNAA